MPDIVHVACKLPSGLQIGDVKIGGTAYERVQGVPPPPNFGGYALAMNVPAQTWNDWAKANEHSRMITHGLIFADANLAALKAKAVSMGHVTSGLEPR